MIGIALWSTLAVVCADAPVSLVAAQAAAAAPAIAEPAPVMLAQAEVEAPAEAAPVVAQPEPAPDELVFAGESDAAVADKMLSAIDSITTLSGDFTQIAPSGAVSTGKFHLRRPGLLRFEYDAPSPLLIVANGGMVFVRDDALETTDSYPVGQTPLKFLLRRKVELGDAVVVGVDRGVDSVAATFASSDEETEGQLTIIMDAPELRLAEWIVRDPRNGITIVTLENVIAGESIANRLFAVPQTESPFLKN